MRFSLVLLFFCMTTSHLSAKVTYSVSFPNAVQHYAQITIEVNDIKKDNVRFKMPVWTPGSYKVREFSQHVDQTWYESKGEKLSPKRIDKNTWECQTKGQKSVSFTYNLYAFEFGVRTSYVDQYMAFLHGPSAFMYAEGFENESITINFNPLNTWQHVEMPLERLENPNSFSCANYDLLADSPVAMGNFDMSTYKTAGVPHKIVMIGNGNYNLDKVTADFKKITDEEVKMFNGKHPSKLYIHFIQNVDNGGGGLEHLNCHTSQMNRWSYQNDEAYLKFLGLVSHEYFHLWNVKRIRPIELGPFDYNKENYTDLLCVAEGVTSYFDDLFLKRAGFYTEENYLKQLAFNINRLENQPGKDVMTLSESSKLAWVKAYLSNENSNNVTISYYNKGMLIAWMLDMEIMNYTDGVKRLDDVMRLLYQKYYTDKKRGFTYQEFIDECSTISGNSLNAFFETYINTTEPIPYNTYLSTTGYSLSNTENSKPSLGIKTKNVNGKCIVTSVTPNSPAVAAGLSANDEIIAVNGWRVEGEINKHIKGYTVDSEIEVTYSRDGKVYDTNATLVKNLEVNYSVVSLEAVSKRQEKMRAIWLN